MAIKKMKKLREAIYDPGDTIPPQGPIAGEDDPAEAVIAIEQAGLGPDGTIVNTFTDAEKAKLLKMLSDKKEFSELEAGVIRALMSNCATVDNIADMVDAVNHKFSGMPRAAAKTASSAIKYTQADEPTLDDVGVAIGSASRRSKGKPVSRVAALKEINRILANVAKRSKAKYGTAIELQKVSKLKHAVNKAVQQKLAAYKKAKFEERKHANAVAKEFYKLVADLHRTQAQHGLAKSEYYIDKFAPRDKDISKMKQFGGTPDER